MTADRRLVVLDDSDEQAAPERLKDRVMRVARGEQVVERVRVAALRKGTQMMDVQRTRRAIAAEKPTNRATVAVARKCCTPCATPGE